MHKMVKYMQEDTFYHLTNDWKSVPPRPGFRTKQGQLWPVPQ